MDATAVAVSATIVRTDVSLEAGLEDIRRRSTGEGADGAQRRSVRRGQGREPLGWEEGEGRWNSEHARG